MATRSNHNTTEDETPPVTTGEVEHVRIIDLDDGDVVNAAALEPVIDTPNRRRLHVVFDVTNARSETGARSIRVMNMPADGQLTAAEAHYLALDLAEAADLLRDKRVALGYDK